MQKATIATMLVIFGLGVGGVVMLMTAGITSNTATVAAAGPPPVETPPENLDPNEFAIDFKDCLGHLRSFIAQGGLAEFGLFVNGFDGNANPGKHVGTVGEEEFLRTVLSGALGRPPTDGELQAFCQDPKGFLTG